MAEKSARPKAAKSDQDPFRKYEEYFVASPDPWVEIVKLEHGGDRTFASTVRAMVTNAEPAQRPGMEDKLLAALAKPELTEVGRMFVCRMLALIGTAKSVPALAALLGDAKAADAARYALDAIEDPAAVEACRAALGKVTGVAKAGLIGSLALRGDKGSIAALQAIQAAADEPAVVKTAAARGLERLTAKS
jgi:hypothetical protein